MTTNNVLTAEQSFWKSVTEAQDTQQILLPLARQAKESLALLGLEPRDIKILNSILKGKVNVGRRLYPNSQKEEFFSLIFDFVVGVPQLSDSSTFSFEWEYAEVNSVVRALGGTYETRVVKMGENRYLEIVIVKGEKGKEAWLSIKL